MRKSPIKWTLEDASNEIIKHSSRNDVYKKNRSLYNYCLKNELLDKYFPLTKRNKRNSITIDEALEISKNYTSKNEFKIKNKRAYTLLVKNHKINLVQYEKIEKYTYDFCKECASKCKNRFAFSKLNYSAYKTSILNGWIDEFFENSKRLTYDRCKEISSKYNGDITLFRKEQYNVYQYMQRNHIIHDFFRKEPKWNYQTCYETAKRYTCKRDFENNEGRCYETARKNKWLDDYTWFTTPILGDRINETKNYIYSYEDNETKTVYVGRTVNIKSRHKTHNNKIRRRTKQISYNVMIPLKNIF